jgi:hypothetical protein
VSHLGEPFVELGHGLVHLVGAGPAGGAVLIFLLAFIAVFMA